MKTKITIVLLALFSLSIVTSCSTSNNVVSKHRIQKRKYNKGYYTSPNHNSVTSTQKNSKDTENLVSKKTNKSIENKIKNKLTETTNTPVNNTLNTKNNNNTTEVIKDTKTPTVKLKKTKSSNSQNQLTNISPTRKNKKEQLTKKIVSVKKQLTKQSPIDSDVMLIILVILAIFLPPLAVFIFEEVTTRFWIDLILWLVGIGVAGIIFGSGLAALGGLIAIIYALLIVLDVI